MKHLDLPSDGIPAIQRDWPSWECPGCGDELRAPEIPDCNDFTSMMGYIRAKACSSCARELTSKFLPRAEILSIAGAPKYERSIEYKIELSYNPGESHLPRDHTRPEIRLEEWPDPAGVWTTPETRMPGIVLLLGPNGCGKSMLATQLLVQAYRKGHSSMAWFRCSELVAEHFLPDFERKRKRQRAERCGVLVLDEYGRGQHSNEFAFALIGEVIDARKHLLTVITTNMAFSGASNTGNSIEETDSSVFDRLTEGLVVMMAGGSRRGRR